MCNLNVITGVCVHTTMHSLVPDLQVSGSSVGEVDTHSVHTTEGIREIIEQITQLGVSTTS